MEIPDVERYSTKTNGASVVLNNLIKISLKMEDLWDFKSYKAFVVDDGAGVVIQKPKLLHYFLNCRSFSNKCFAQVPRETTMFSCWKNAYDANQVEKIYICFGCKVELDKKVLYKGGVEKLKKSTPSVTYEKVKVTNVHAITQMYCYTSWVVCVTESSERFIDKSSVNDDDSDDDLETRFGNMHVEST